MRSRCEHDGLALFGELLGAQHRRVDEATAVLAGELGETLGASETDRAGLRPDRMLRRRGQRPLHDLRHRIDVEEHRDHHVRPGHRLGRICGDLGAVIGQRPALSALRFQTVTSSPPFSKLRAIPAPMIPVPSTATLLATSAPSDRIAPASIRNNPAMVRSAARADTPVERGERIRTPHRVITETEASPCTSARPARSFTDHGLGRLGRAS